MTEWIFRFKDAPLPYQIWRAFPPHSIVQVKNVHGESRIALVSDMWWGYEQELGEIGEGVIMHARRLDKEKDIS